MNVDLAASGVAFKERYNMPVIPEMVAREQPEALREYFFTTAGTLPYRVKKIISTAV